MIKIIDTSSLPQPVKDWLIGDEVPMRVVDNRAMRRAEESRGLGLTIQAVRELRRAARAIETR